MKIKYNRDSPPPTVEDAAQRRGELLHELAPIASQAYKLRVTNEEREAYGVLIARKHEIEGELGFLKRWIKREGKKQSDSSREGYASQQPTGLLREAKNIIRRLQEEGAKLEPREMTVLAAIDMYLSH